MRICAPDPPSFADGPRDFNPVNPRESTGASLSQHRLTRSVLCSARPIWMKKSLEPPDVDNVGDLTHLR
jgi:hypothetical protein